MVYGATSTQPVSETDRACPMSVYAAGKLATETYLQLYAKESDIALTILRYATVYGPMETVPRAIPNFIRRVLSGRPPIIYGKGGDIRDYVHVLDVVEVFLVEDKEVFICHLVAPICRSIRCRAILKVDSDVSIYPVCAAYPCVVSLEVIDRGE